MPLTPTYDRVSRQPRSGITFTEAPASSPPTDPLIALYGDSLDPRIRDSVSEVTNALGPIAVSRRNIVDRIFSFVEGTAMGFRLEEKEYDIDDPYVRTSPVRSAVAEALRMSTSKDVRFLETSGLMEIGGGFMAGFGLDAFAFGGAGWGYSVTGSTLFRYRTSVPVVGAAQHKSILFPFDAQSALKLTPGTEVEMTGQGRVFTGVGISARVGYSLPGLATAGVGAVVAANTSVKDEVSLNVMALEKPGMVRVTIRNLDEVSLGLLARVRLGLIFNGNAITGNILGNILVFYAQKLHAVSFEELINTYTTLNASLYMSSAYSDLTIGSWDLDLTQAPAREAYNCLVRLNTLPAEVLAREESGGVVDVHVSENETEFRLAGDIGLLGQRLFLYEVLETERRGSVNSLGANLLVYRDSLYTRRKRNIVTGSQEINWEAVNVRRQESVKSERYLRLHFVQREFEFHRTGIDRVLRFANALQIPRAELVGEDPDCLEKAAKRLGKMAEVNISTDVYFTKTGIDNIDKADKAKAKVAYLKVSRFLKKKFAQLDFTCTDDKTLTALALIDEYRSYIGLANISRFAERIKVLPIIRREYMHLMNRNIESDAKLISEAEAFGDVVEELTDTNNPEQVSSFFLSLGRMKGFDYMQTIAALSELAGVDQTLVNDLSISAKGVNIRSKSDFALVNPRETVALHLHRTSSVNNNA